MDKSNTPSSIVSRIGCLRDPFILVEKGVYYAYGTGWVCYKNDSGDLSGEWQSLGVVATKPQDSVGDHWAPEVHKYNGRFYMFTTYRSSKNSHRGCCVLSADSPEGPFELTSDGHFTPADWDAIDATLYIDEQGTPWTVFVHEWTSTDDGIGRMVIAPMSPDLTHLCAEPTEIFRADDPKWSTRCVTDGCWMHRCQSGELLMLWSNWDEYGYCVAISRSDNRRIDGKWMHDEAPLFSRGADGKYDGGHGMIFTALDGTTYLSLHSPNAPHAGRVETPVFIPICEKNGSLHILNF